MLQYSSLIEKSFRVCREGNRNKVINTQCANGESNKIVSEKKTTVTAWKYLTPINSGITLSQIIQIQKIKDWKNIKCESHCCFDKIIEQSTVVWSAD